MRICCLAIVAVVLSSCGLVEIGGNGGGKHEVWTGPGQGPGGTGGSGGKEKSVCYITGFDYPDGYDWKADPESGSVKCSLVVFADMVPVMKVPVGESYETGSDPDMHRIIGGHLYTDWSTGSETVIKKDGRLLFRYPGREMICGMLVDGDDVHTIGLDRGGAGFTYRKNGEVLLERKSGYLFEHLRIDSAGISFAFCEPVGSGASVQGRYYNVLGGVVSQVAVRDDVKAVHDIICRDGEVSYIASLVGINEPVVVSGGQMSTLDLPPGAKMPACRFVGSGDEVLYVEGIFTMEGMPVTGGLWRGGSIFKLFDPGYTASSLCTWDDGICCVLSSAAADMPGLIFRFGEIYPMPDGYAMMGNCPIASVNGILYVGLSSLSGMRPAVWKDGSVEALDINGYISSIYVDGVTHPMKGCATSLGLR